MQATTSRAQVAQPTRQLVLGETPHRNYQLAPLVIVAVQLAGELVVSAMERAPLAPDKTNHADSQRNQQEHRTSCKDENCCPRLRELGRKQQRHPRHHRRPKCQTLNDARLVIPNILGVLVDLFLDQCIRKWFVRHTRPCS